MALAISFLFRRVVVIGHGPWFVFGLGLPWRAGREAHAHQRVPRAGPPNGRAEDERAKDVPSEARAKAEAKAKAKAKRRPSPRTRARQSQGLAKVKSRLRVCVSICGVEAAKKQTPYFFNNYNNLNLNAPSHVGILCFNNM